MAGFFGFVAITSWLLMAITVGIVNNARGGSGIIGFLGGAVFGVFALIWVLVRDRAPTPFQKRCADCFEIVPRQARICRACGFDFVAAAQARADTPNPQS